MLSTEPKLTLSQAAKRIPGRPHPSTLWRHISQGYLAADGSRIHLEHVRYGRRIFTSIEAVERFAKRIADASYVAHDRRGGRRQDSWRKVQDTSDDELSMLDNELDAEGF